MPAPKGPSLRKEAPVLASKQKNKNRRPGRPPQSGRENLSNYSGSRPRSAPPPMPPIQYQYSGSMKGYEEEIMPPRRTHQPVDNGILFPGPEARRSSAPSGGGAQGRTTRYPSGGAQSRRPRSGGQRLRPADRPASRSREIPPGSPQRAAAAQQRLARKKRRLTRAMVRRRRLRRRITAALLLLAVVAAGSYLTMVMLFKISAIEMRDASGQRLDQAGGYTSAQVLEALGVQLEENIFSFDPEEKAAALEQAFPLLEQIEVQRVYPSTVVVQVTPAQPAYGMQAGNGWVTLSASLKILTTESQQPELPVLWGGEPVSLEPGVQLEYRAEPEQPAASSSGASSESGAASEAEPELPEDRRLETLQGMLAELERRGLLSGVTRLEYASAEDAAFLYEDRISVRLGTLNELEYKMDYVEYMLRNENGDGCAATDTGTLDCSHVRSDGTVQVIFAQGEPELPSGYQVPEELPEEPEPPAAAEETAPGETPAESGGTAEPAPQDTAETEPAQTETAPAAGEQSGG